MPLTRRRKPENWIAQVEEVKLRSKRRKKRRRAELFRQKKKLARQRLILALALALSGPDVDRGLPVALV
jgi:hypothetical protein